MIQGIGVLAGFAGAILLGILCYGANPASLPNYAMTLLNAVLALFAYASDRKRKVNRAFALFVLLVAGWGADVTFLFLAPTEEFAAVGIRFARLGLLYFFPGMIYFVMVFTRRERPRWPLHLALAWSTLLAIVSLSGSMDAGIVWKGKTWAPVPNGWYHVYSLLVGLAPCYSAVLAFVAWRRESVPRLRLQYKQFFISFLVMAFPGWTNQIATYVEAFPPGSVGAAVSFYGTAGAVLFFVIIAYAIVRNRWLDLSFVVRRTLLYSTLTAGIAAVYALMLMAFSTLFQGGVQTSYAASIATIVVVAFAFLPVREQLQRTIDRMFYRDAYDDRLMMQRMTETVARVIGNRQISETVLDALVPAMKIRKAQILLSGTVFEKPFGGPLQERNAPPIPIPDAPIDRTEPSDGTPVSLLQYLDREGLELAYPVVSKDQAAGILFIGPKLSELPYRSEESQILSTVAQQIGIAAENSRLYEQILSMKTYNDNILRSMDDGLITFDTAGGLVSVNPAAERILGRVPSGRADEAFSDLPAFATIIRETLEKGSGVHHIETALGPEGERTLLVTSAPLNGQDGKVVGGLVLFADISEKKDMERRLERDRRLAMIGQLASQIAHEIRNPIGSMKLLIDSLPDFRSDPKFEKVFMETVPAEIDRLNRLVGDLLDFARPPRLIRVDIDLLDLIENALRLSQDVLAPIKVRREFPKQPLIVHADGEKLKQVLLNLIKNAAQSMRDTPTRELGIRVLQEGSGRVEISDTGIGMDERQLGKIFTPFYSTKADGTGLGLAVVHRIIEEHGWTIEVQSKPGAGSTFAISIRN